ncbi:AN1 zinc finger protein [Talaromyces stipitatus ATCC 10500]|uniref:AN1 zinc finger protein n=1 Tax=Talaromyces stipitatus (strain ATCC 10500 / CBS 375.48 / QM 6759 / NRRL 1006) TaxID=441959 RepID=B8MDT6_TALSN|nr:AN1 zinc finger protein [Talaromyces stipitatus ATCC 10500]EED18315.1 AN1 zinc finger protein [Talaromyces stipitatus ATCC 10500]
MSSPQPTSFTEMADVDLESIGRNCQYEYCHQLDFLPFRCESCRGTFCSDHRTEAAHKCTHPGEWARRRRELNNKTTTSGGGGGGRTVKSTVYNSDQCSHPQCKTLHRLREGHDCANLIPLGARAGGKSTDNAATIRSMFSKLRGLGNNIQPPKAPKISLPASIQARRTTTGGNAITQLNEIKRTAKGEASIPTDKRIYLHVVGTTDKPTAETPPSGNYWFDSRWKVGRVLDDAARKLKVENLNNRVGGEEAKLRIFHVESGEFLEFSVAIGGEGSKVKSGHTIVLLRGAGVLLDK